MADDGEAEPTQCERHPLCVRGFRHLGRGGHCSIPGGGPNKKVKGLTPEQEAFEAMLAARAAQSAKLMADRLEAKRQEVEVKRQVAAPAGASVCAKPGKLGAKHEEPTVRPGDAGFVWKGQVVDVPGTEFGESVGGTSYRGEIVNASGMHVHIYFREVSQQPGCTPPRCAVCLS